MDPSMVHSLAVVVLMLALYFAPLIVAVSREHHQRMAIGVLNVFLGWSGLGWIIALVWACTAVAHPSAITQPTHVEKRRDHVCAS